MILEIADLRVEVAQSAAFEAALQRGVETVIAHSAGFKGRAIVGPFFLAPPVVEHFELVGKTG